MSSVPQVGQGAVPIVPTFKGFRTAVNKETGGAAKDSAKGFRSIWSKTGDESGKSTGKGFRKAFEGESTGFTSKATRELEQAVSKSARAVSAARLKEQDAAGKARVAERQLAEARERYSSDSSQVVRAEERMATATRQLETAQEQTKASTNDLRRAQERLAESADRAGDELSGAGGRSARRFQSGFTEVFKGSFLGSAIGNLASSLVSNIGYAIGDGLRQGISFALGTVDIASDLNESVNAVNVAYGSVSDDILAIGETSAQTFGLSQRDLNKYAVQFSAFSKTIAGRGGNVVGTFSSILGRATDFASVMNLNVSDALLLFQSGLAGETEPLRRYGIDLSAATVEAYALATGIGDGTRELTEAEKQQARYGSLLEQTSLVQGDFANTSEELANQNRINAATWDDLQAKIGTAFLPIATDLAGLVADDLLPAIEQLVEEQGPGLAQMFEDALPAMIDLAEQVLPQLPGLFESAAETLPPLIEGGKTLAPIAVDLTEGLSGLVGMLGGFFGLIGGNTDILTLRDQMTSLPGPLGQAFQGAVDLGEGFGSGIGTALFHVRSLAEGVSRTVGDVIVWFEQLPGRIAGFFTGAGTWLFNSGKSLIQGFIDGINEMFKPIGDAVSGVLEWAQGFFPNSPAKRGPLSGSGWDGLKASGGAVMEQWTSGFARPDLSGALAPAFGAATTPAGVAASYMGPSTLVIVDADGQLISRMRVEADASVSAKARSSKVTYSSGRRSGA